tara:strand:+ start:275 stop:739 length:465 start_codon:yes stop_codon:yes gene_type:complete
MALVDFAKLDSKGLVLDVTVLNSEEIEKDGVVNEDLGIQKCAQLTGHPTWKMFDKDMLGDVHLKGGTKFRKNSASIGGTYDASRDAFIPIKEASQFVFNETTCMWEPPFSLTSVQASDNSYWWSESENTYVGVTTEKQDIKWNTSTNAWENWTP